MWGDFVQDFYPEKNEINRTSLKFNFKNINIYVLYYALFPQLRIFFQEYNEVISKDLENINMPLVFIFLFKMPGT